MMRLAVFGCFSAVMVVAEWPMWRGAEGLGMAPDASPPARWSKTENVRWRTPLPEPGNSTPIVWGDRIYITQARTGAGLRSVMAFDRATGKLVWESSVKAPDAGEETHATNPYASSSPATDGERIIAWFGRAGAVAFDRSGKELWRRDLGLQKHTWGYASSPVIEGGRVFLHFGPGSRSFLVALDKRSGKTLWQVDIPAGAGAKFANWNPEDMYGSWSTPLMSGGELLVSHPKKLVAYAPATGKVLWEADGLGDLVYPSPLASGGVVVAASGFQGPAIGVKSGGERLWRIEKSRSQIGTGVITGGHLYTVDTNGVAHCQKLETGETVWSQRLAGTGGDNGVWSSPVLNGGRIWVVNKSGRVFQYEAKPVFELLGSSTVDEATNASVVLSGPDLILRTHEALWAFGTK
jgi:outer membrane protein assembly factor BamB